MCIHHLLNHAKFLHHLIQLVLGGISHGIADRVHPLFHLEEGKEGRSQHICDGHAFFQNGMLIQIADTDIFCPLNLSLIRHQLSGNDVHKG